MTQKSIKHLFLYTIIKSAAAQNDYSSLDLSTLVSSDYEFPEDVKTALGFPNQSDDSFSEFDYLGPDNNFDSASSIINDPDFGYRGKGPRKNKLAPPGVVESESELGAILADNDLSSESGTNFCEPLVGSKQTKFTAQCSSNIESCTISCFSGNKPLVPHYLDSEGNLQVLNYLENDEFGKHIIFNCNKKLKKWDVDFDISTVRCTQEVKSPPKSGKSAVEKEETLEEAISKIKLPSADGGTPNAAVEVVTDVESSPVGKPKKKKKVPEKEVVQTVSTDDEHVSKPKKNKKDQEENIFEALKDIVTTEAPKQLKTTVPGPNQDPEIESPEERGKNNKNNLNNSLQKDVFVDPGKNDDISGITCPMTKKQPDNGHLICPNVTPSRKGDNSEQNVQAGDLCKINCLKGYKSNGYTEITCLAVKNLRTGEIEGVWSEKRKVDCVLRELLTTTQASKTQTTLKELELTEAITTTRAPIYHGAYFPNNLPDSVRLPNGYGDLTTSVNEYDNLSNEDRYTGHNIILNPGKCIVCTEAKSMKKCLMQQKTCDLRRSEVCYTEVRKEQGHIVINRGCLARRNCLAQYSNNIRYENHNEALKSESGLRPDQQCRLVGKDLSRGRLSLDDKKVRTSQKCMSCHKSAFSIPYF